MKTMKFKVLVLLTVPLFFLSAFSGLSQSAEIKLGLVDLETVTMFHPESFKYSPDLKMFFSELKTGEPVATAVKKRQELIRTTEREIESTWEEGLRLSELLDGLADEFKQLQQELASQVENGQLSREEYLERLPQYEEMFFKKRDDMEKRHLEISDKNGELYEKLRMMGYQDVANNDQTVKSISEEIRQIVEEIRLSNGYALIFNSPRQLFFRYDQDLESFSFHRIYNPRNDREPENYWKKLENSAEPEYLKEFSQNIFLKCQIFAGYQGSAEGAVVTGAEDLTVEVLRKLLTRKNISQTTIDLLVRVYQNGKFPERL